MRHARAAALDELEELVAKLRALPGLKEKSRGIFYRGSKSFVHFHEDPEGLFADARLGEDFERFRVSTAKERATFFKAVRAALAETPDAKVRFPSRRYQDPHEAPPPSSPPDPARARARRLRQ